MYSARKGWWKLADFGITSDSGDTSTFRTTSRGRGSSGHRSPELVRDIPHYNKKADIWSLGCVLYELCTRRRAFVNDNAVREFRSPDTVLRVAVFSDGLCPGFRDEARTWMRRMLQREYQQRPSAQVLAAGFGNLFSPSAPAADRIGSWMEARNMLGTDGPLESGVVRWRELFAPGTYHEYETRRETYRRANKGFYIRLFEIENTGSLRSPFGHIIHNINPHHCSVTTFV